MSTYNGQVTGGGLNLRQSASTSASILIQIPNTTQIVVSDYSANSDWYCTTYSGNSGFVMKTYVNILSSVATRQCNVTGGGLNLRLYPSTSASSPIQIPNNTALTVQTHNSTWSSTTYGGYSGFVMSQYLTAGGTGNWVTRWIAPGEGQTVNIRPDASMNNPPVAVWTHGTKVEVNAPNSTWSEVRLYGSTTISGWVMTQYLSATDPGGSGGGTWVTRWIAPGEGQTVNIRPDASMNNPPVAIWTHGTKVEVNAPNSTWSEVRLYGSTTISGWVMTQYLSATDPGGSGGGTGTVYVSVCTWPSTLTSAQRLSNVQYIYDFLRAQGFTKQAACGVLGNMETESNFNPGIWQSMNSLTLGYGLVQWDDATKFINRARDTGVISTATAAAVNALANNDPKALMDAELACLIWGCTSQGEFFYSSNYTTSGCSFTFSQYKASTLSAYTLGMAFHDHFERSAGGTSAIQARGDKALAWYNSL